MQSVDPEFWMKEVSLKLDVITLLAVFGNLCLALRHPLNVGESRDIVLKFCQQVGEQLVFLGALTPEQLEEAYTVESEEGTPELLDEANMESGMQKEENGAEKFITGMNSDDLFEMLLRDARCCACGSPMSISLHLNFVSLDKKAAWKKPTWDNRLLKPVYPRVPRAIAVLCDECIKNSRQAAEVIEVEGTEIRYHRVSDLENAFEITPDMIITNIRDLRE